MIAPTVIMRRLTPQFELHLICRKRHLPLKGKTKGHSGKLLCRADVAREFPGLLRSSEPGKKLSTALMLREATMAVSYTHLTLPTILLV